MIKKLSAFYAKLSKREKMILYGSAAALTVLFTDRLVLGSVLEKLGVLETQIREEEALVRKSLVVSLRKDQIIADGQKLVDYSVDAENPEKEMTDFLQELEAQAKSAGVNLVYVKPGSTQAQGEITRLLATLECEAQMPEVAVFFHHVESSNELLRVEKYEIQPKNKESSIARCAMTVSKTVLTVKKI